MNRITRWFALGALVALASAAGAYPLQAQADVIRGRVTSSGSDSLPVTNATVTATSLSGNVSRTAKTDRNGRFTIIFPGGDGDYFITFTAIGYVSRRYELKRTAEEDILVAEAKLVPNIAILDTMTTVAYGPRNRPLRSDTSSDVGGADRRVNTANVPPDLAGNLAAMAASLPGVLFIQGVNGDPSGYSVLGLDPDQNSQTLNGMSGGDMEIPRDASVSVSLAMSPYDVSQGQFSGGRLNVRTNPGSNFLSRNNSLLFNTPSLEWTDRTGRALGQEYTNANLSGSLAGPVRFDKAFYNFSYQLGRRANDLQTLLNTNSVGLQAQGIAADSVARLVSVLQSAQVPATVSRTPADQLRDQGIVLGAFDFAPPSSANGQAINITVNGSWNRMSPASQLTTALPAYGFNTTAWNAGIRARHTTYFTFGVLSETGVALRGSRRFIAPYLELPAGSVLVNSDFDDGASGVRALAFGGATIDGASTNNAIDVGNQLSWFSQNNKHRIRFTTSLRREAYSVEQANNQLGTWSFNSLSDLQLGKPTSFTRQLTPFESSGSELIGGISLGDSYRARRNLQFVYGARLDGNRFIGAPDFNADVLNTYGARNDHLPNGLYVSPRLGFAWTYGRAQQIGAFIGAAAVPRAVLRGGIGVFQNALAANLPGQAIANTGLARAVQQLTCIGNAAPVPNWGAYGNDASAIPAQCADGSSGTVFESGAPNVSLFARNYESQRSLRGNLQWEGAILGNRLKATFGGVYSHNMNQPGFADLNFDPTVGFTLSNERSRPVFVDATSIVPTTGAIATRDGRVSPLFNRVSELRSTFSSTSRQFSVQLAPLSLNSGYSWQFNYVLNSVRDDRANGFTNTAGNPLTFNTGRSAADWRHMFIGSLTANLFDFVRIEWSQRFLSGMPFTPTITGDINGDGYSNDRAFVYDASDPRLGGSMQTLLDASNDRVRDCLQRQTGTIAGRNSCEGPWTTVANMGVSFNPVKLRLPQRATLSFSISNPLGAADLMLHGSKNTRGWGQTPTPDPRLLIVRGFDQQALRYNYEVNQRFGGTSQAVSAIRNPVVITMSLRLDVGPPRERQALTQTLDRGRTLPGNKAPEGILRAVYGNGGIVNPLAAILRSPDSLNLTGAQADTLAALNRWYVTSLDSIWTPVAREYAALPNHYDTDDVYQQYRRAREASVDLLVKVAPTIKSLLTPSQRRKLPALITAYLDPRYLAAIRSGTSGTPGGVFAPGTGAGPLGGPAARGGE